MSLMLPSSPVWPDACGPHAGTVPWAKRCHSWCCYRSCSRR